MSKPDKPLFEHRRERRGILGKGLAALAAAPLAGCDVISNSETGKQVLRSGEHLSYAVHRLLGRKAMAQEFPAADIAPVFRANGTLMPPGPEYAAMMASNFTAWRLKVGGLVNKPLELDLDELRALPARTQITRHDCVEGWSCIGQWKGVRLSHLLDMAGVKAQAKFVVFHCLDKMEEDDNKSMYYESIDL
ncbi:MAG: molybdopterin-dependent oxidoreductase, partial [Ramlibacter sp.]